MGHTLAKEPEKAPPSPRPSPAPAALSSHVHFHTRQALRQSCLDTLRRCQHPEGGFGGGPGQLPHLAPTYAAVNCLAILGPDALDIVDRFVACATVERLGACDSGADMRTAVSRLPPLLTMSAALCAGQSCRLF